MKCSRMTNMYNVVHQSFEAYKIIHIKVKYNLCDANTYLNAYYMVGPMINTLCILLYVK